MIEKFISKINQWFNEPVGDTGVVPGEKENELKRTGESFKGSQYGPVQGQPNLRLVPRHEEEFYHRGSAGRHESHAAKGFSKAVMPRSGRRAASPKKTK
jgi:hypothetical protein